jgi:hypothetical protein
VTSPYSGIVYSALISCNFIIKNEVHRKITSYIYLLIFTKSIWFHVKHFIALTKRESVWRFFFVITDQDYPYQHIEQWPRKKRESTTAVATKKCVRLKWAKSDSYLTYGQSRKTWNNGVFCLIISYLRIKSYNVLNYNNCSTDWSFPLTISV